MGRVIVGLLVMAWVVAVIVVVGHLSRGSGSPPALGIAAGLVALGAWLALDRLGRSAFERWRNFWRDAGRASPIAIAAGVSVIAGTLVYGGAYLSTGNEELEDFGHYIDFQGPLRDDRRSGFYVSAVFRIDEVDGCDDPVSVELAAFPRGDTDRQVDAERVAFAFTPAAIDKLGHETVPAVGPRNGLPVVIPSGGLLERVVDHERIEGIVPRDAWVRGPVVARFTSDLLEPRTENSCWLVLPQFPDASRGPVAPQQADGKRLESWTRVETASQLDVDADASSPPPQRDYNGLPVWKCERQRGACSGVAVITEESAEDARDLNLLAMGLLLSLGSAALLEGILDGLRRAGRERAPDRTRAEGQ